MERVFDIVLAVHIAAGILAFIAAPLAMLVKKGGRNHRISGKIFFWAMTGVCATGFAMSLIHPNIFLLAVSGFSYYLVLSGYRWTAHKRMHSLRDLPIADRLVMAVAGLFNGFLLFLGLYVIMNNPGAAVGYIAAVFGVTGVLFVAGDIRTVRRSAREKGTWLFRHMGGMVGGYIATVSAFSAVNFDFLPMVIQWLWPTIIGAPLLTVWIGTYKRRMAKRGQVDGVI